VPEQPDTSPQRSNDTIGKILLVAVTLCVVCSVIVSTAAVTLRPLQEANKALERKRNILLAAGLLREGEDINSLFEQVDTRLVDLATGEYVEGVDATTYDQRAAAKAPKTSVTIPHDRDIAKIRRRARYAPVYLVRDNTGVRSVILPVHGHGLYSTLYGFIALSGDGNTVQGLRFYEHGETPGLGGQVDSPAWLDKWPGKRVYDEGGKVRLAVIKGTIERGTPEARYQVDGLAGATMTSRGVTNLVRYWLGEDGFEPFLARIHAQRG
jgi:Na+-transporting NADH:ubiquinone oxidoreductase subunit C